MSDTTVGTDPSVCYRHPGRQSWVLCQRCGRTVCPECQIQAPVGVHCPECVRETSGGVQWRPTNVAPLQPKRRRAPSRVRTLVAPGGSATVDAPKVILGAAIVLFVVGCFTPIPFLALAAIPSSFGVPFAELQLWRYLTNPFVSTAGGISAGGLISFGLSAVFFWLTAPQISRMLGTPRFLAVFFSSAAAGSAAALLAGGVGAGLTAPLFGSFAALLVVVWDDQRARTQILLMIAVNLLLTIAIGGAAALALLVAAMIAGTGATYLFRIAPDRGWQPRTPWLILVGGCALLVAVAAVRALA